MISLVTLFGAITPERLPNASFETSIPEVLRIVFVTATLLSIIFVAIGGIKYTLSSGDPQGAAKAKNTILYALVGLVIALLSFTIVSFVGGRLT